MQSSEKRIVVRVEEEQWREFDDKRHAERTTFQELGLRLFQNWMASDKILPVVPEKRDNIPESVDITDAERQWTRALVGILRSDNQVAAQAIKSNLLAFVDYVRAVPDAAGKFSDIAAKAEELAVLDRAVDAAKTAAVARGRASPATYKKDARRAGGK